ncbi:3-hydroxyacyl-CoA dehydrogenase family protein [Janthinobacterium sp. PC23-8]|uniref:3-hydroxyacyl-CoA dehydrogenase family protein n=1 Tax=Janthinobacterium sp. PC23-8 TaxID=2012679 RepID=UPI0015955666|nr:3-hydroxyacyl-CoA dehydrogenase family protein [Janthinobacterium sp. PC23-8]
MSIKKITVIGAGAMGRQIALQCALRGFSVVLHDSRQQGLDEAFKFCNEYLDGRIAKGKLIQEGKEAALARLRATSDLADAARDADLVIEAIVEQFEPKAELFRRLDGLCPKHTLFASNSSNIRASRLAETCGRPGRMLNLHFFNPALVMELVEVVVHPAVSEQVIDAAMEFCRAIGKAPVLMRKEIPGFIVNRIFRALTREAISLYEGGYATAEDIDLAVVKGLGHPMGPLRLLDATGIDVSYLARMDEYLETGVESAKPNPILKQMYERGTWGKKSGKGFYTYPQK